MAHGSACDPWRLISKGRCGIKHVTRTSRLAFARQSKTTHASCAYWWHGPATSQKKGSQNIQKHGPILGYTFWPVFWDPFHKLVGGGSPGTKSVPKARVVFRTRFCGFWCHFLHQLATQCAPQHAPSPPEAVSNFRRWVQSHAMRISSRRAHTKAEEGRAQRSSGSAHPPMHE